MAEIDVQIEQLNKNVETVISDSKQAKELATKADTRTAEMVKQLEELNKETKEVAEWRKEAEAIAKKDREALNAHTIELKTLRENGLQLVNPNGTGIDFGMSFAKGMKDNFEEVKTTSKGRAKSFELSPQTALYTKAAANMTTAGNLTGDSVLTYMPTPYLIPRQMVNFRDLVPGFQSATGTIAIFRENYNGGVSPQEGAFGQQLTQGALKEQVGYDFTHVNFTANYISGFVRIAKQMLQDLPFLQTYLPGMLLRDYYKYENSVFYAAQVAAALGTYAGTGGNDAEKMLYAIAALETANFLPNGIVTTPAIWVKLLTTGYPATATSYSTPLGFVYNQSSGNVEIAGIPVLKANWVTAGTALIADWTQSQIATVDGLKVEFFEQDSDNVQRNLITVRVEARVVLVTGQPYAFTQATGL